MKIISRSMVISLSVLFMLFGTTAAFAHMDENDSGKTKGMVDSGTMKGSGMMGSDKTEAKGSGSKGCPQMSSGMTGSGMMKGMKGSGMMKSGMMKGMMNSGMMKKCRAMMGANAKDRGIQTLINHQDELSLTDEQVATLKSLGSSLAKATIRNNADLQIAEMELDELLNKDEVKMSSVESKLKQVQNLRTEIRLSRIRAQLQAKALLNEEQRKALKSLK